MASNVRTQLNKLSAAEEFLAYFGVDYQQAVVNVNRLHILKRFNQYLGATPGTFALDDAALHATCKELLTRAYQDFVRSTAAQEKVFKVFQDQDGGSVSLDNLRQSLPSQTRGA